MDTDHERLRALVDSERYHDAIALASDCIIKYPPDPRFYYLRGWCYYILNEHASAQADFEKCLEIDPDYFNGYKGLASIYEAKGLYDLAEANYHRALALAPNAERRAAIYANLGELYLYSKREYKRALRLIKRSIALHDIGDSYFNLGVAYLKMNDNAKAEKNWLKAVDTRDFIELKFKHLILYLLSLEYNEREEHTRALEFIDRAMQLSPNNSQYLRLQRVIKQRMDRKM